MSLPVASSVSSVSSVSSMSSMSPVRRPRLAGRPLLIAGLVSSALVLACPPVTAHGRDDHDRAREALAAGEVMPLEAALERLQRTRPGRVLDVELEREDGRWIYQVKLMQAGGRLLRVDVDARTAEELRVRERRRGTEGRGDGARIDTR